MIVGQDKKPPLEEAVMHFGTKGMKWGVRKASPLPKGTSSKNADGSPRVVRDKNMPKGGFKNKAEADAYLQNYMNKQASAAVRRRAIRAGAIRTALILSLVGARVLINATTGQDVNLQDRYIDA